MYIVNMLLPSFTLILLGVALRRLSNWAVLHALAHKNGGLFKELARNPLLIATAGGLLYSLLGLPIPEVAGAVLSRLGSAALTLGLLLVGAGLRLIAVQRAKTLSAYFLAVKLLALPTLALLIRQWFGLVQAQLTYRDSVLRAADGFQHLHPSGKNGR